MARVGKTAAGTPHKNVIVLRVRMRFYQTCDHLSDKVLLGTLELETDDIVPFDEDGPIPCKVEWVDSTVKLLGTAKISCIRSLRPKLFERSFEAGYTLRNRGGRSYDQGTPHPKYERGGYVFAASQTADVTLVGNGGARFASRLLRVEVQLNAGKRYPLLLRYPAEPRQDWIYRQHEFQLWLQLTIGEANWELEGPTVVHPDYEFPSDPDHPAASLKKALTVEYGNPGAKPPLQARDYLRCVDPARPIGQALRTHLAAAALFINGQIPGGEAFTVTPVEIANTMLTEGGVLVLQNGISAGVKPENLKFDGYQHLGIDSYATRWKASEGNLRAFTKDTLEPYLTDPKGRNLRSQMDEQKHLYATFRTLNLEEAVFAVAGLYPFFKERFALAVADVAVMGPWATDCDDLPLHLQHFWATWYFNTSSGRDRGTPRIRQGSLEYHDLIWSLEDDHAKYCMNGKYNAAWRTATFRFLAAQSGL